jgi:membrane-associated protein
MIISLIDFILHIDKHLGVIAAEYSVYAYLIIFSIIFVETGVVFAPFLPGDSLLFAAGALAAAGIFKIGPLYALILIAAIIGDTVNYHVGKYIGPKIFNRQSSILFNRKHLLRAQEFYEKNGKKTIILARFIPIIRTFAPFVAGIGRMEYHIFLAYNVIGAFLWTTVFLVGGYAFGNISWVKENFGLIVIAVIIISVLPLLKEVGAYYIQNRKNSGKL